MWRYFTKHQTLRYIEALPGFMRSYNKTYHRTIRMAPTSVDASNQETVWQRIHGGDAGRSKPKLRVDDRVQGKETIQERLHGELEWRTLHRGRGAPVRPTRIPTDWRRRNDTGRNVLRTKIAESNRLAWQTLSRGSCTATPEKGEVRRSTSEIEWLPSFIQHLDRRQGGRGVQRVIASRTRCMCGDWLCTTGATYKR